MAEVQFNYNGTKVIIHCELNNKMKTICQKYLDKINEDRNNIYFY